MKKILSILLVVVMMFSMINISVYATATADVVINGAEITAKPGETVDVPIVIQKNKGFCGLNLYFTYSNSLTFVSLTNAVDSLTCTNIVTTVWDGADNYTGTGNLAVLKFTVPVTAEYNSKYTIQINFIEAYDVELNDVSVTTSAASITIVCPHANTTIVPEEPADCDENGYTAGVYCNDCEIYISGHEQIPATENHTDVDGKWESNEENHFHTCACGRIFDTVSHSGGTASCTKKAKCSSCEAEYGQINANNHVGATTTINASEPNHKTQTPGYTGDTKCLDCGEIIDYGQPIEPGTHTPADLWSKDETYHWKECNVVGCGVVIDGSKAEHSSDKPENKATCQKQAICDVCGVAYGEFALHNYTAENKKQDALKSEANCRDNAVYYYSCSMCGLVENNDNHIFFGDKASDIHVGGTTILNASEANHKMQIDGYTGDTKCLGCDEITAYGQPILAGAHIPSNNWSADDTRHWKICTVENCGVVIEGSAAAHNATGINVATCKTQAICDVCQKAHGSLDKNNHSGGTTIVNAAEPNHKEQIDGYTGDTKCLGCDEIIAYGQTIPADAHTPADLWSKDETYHWKECNVVGCGVVIDGSKAEHSSDKPENKATCQKQAICDVCGVAYGEFALHNYTAENKKQDALKSEANCRDNAVYYYSCSMCGLVENNDNHIFFGDKASDIHVGGTTILNASEANHKMQIDGYTGDTKCLGCDEITAYGQPILAGAHIPSNNWSADDTRHWKICTVENCGVVIEGSAAAHNATGINVATCKTQAICDVCQKAHGSLDKNNHSGGTTIVNAAEPNHKEQIDGYTGDTKCLGCDEIIAYGQTIPADAHTPADLWSKDETYHWKECNVVGCGVVIDGSKAEHSSDKPENKATCQKQAICDVCGVAYGEFALHNYTAENKKQDALKSEANCRDNAVYYYSCSMCGLVENNDNHIFFGDKASDIHVGGTTILNASEANHKMQIDGYTGDTKCLGCDEITAYGQPILAGAHIPSNNWSADDTRHWKICTVENCGVVIEGSAAAHNATGINVATCKTQAICEVCQKAHGSLDKNNHSGGTTIVNAAEPNHKEQIDGYTGDTKCLGCDEIIAYGQTIPADAHTPADLWSKDETYHWKECNVVGCGVIIDGSKAEHSSEKTENKATCQNKPVCDVCGVSYGEVAPHDWNTASWEKDATGHWHDCQTTGCNEKTGFNEHTPDHDGGASEDYAVKCTDCQYIIYEQLAHTHVFDKEVSETKYEASKATCITVATYYKSCECGEKGTETFSYGILAEHHDANNDGKCDECEYVVSDSDIDNPQTGDESMIYLWVILLCGSGLGIFVTTVFRKKRMF